MRPDVKITKSVLMQTVLRLGDIDLRPDEAIEISIKTSKCTALQRPKAMKKFAKRTSADEDGDITMEDDDERKDVYAQLVMVSEYFVKKNGEEDEDKDEDESEEGDELNDSKHEKVEKENLVRGYKYGSTYVPCPDDFAHLTTKRGMDICGFFPLAKVRIINPLAIVVLDGRIVSARFFDG